MKNRHISKWYAQLFGATAQLFGATALCILLVGCGEPDAPTYMKPKTNNTLSQKPLELEIDRAAKIAPTDLPLTADMHNLIELKQGNNRIGSIKVRLNFASGDFNRLTLVGLKSANSCLNGFLPRPTLSLASGENQVSIAQFENEIGLQKNKFYTILIQFSDFQCDYLSLKMDLIFALDYRPTASMHLSLAKVCEGPDSSKWTFLDKELPLNVFNTSKNEELFLGSGFFCGQKVTPQIDNLLTCQTEYNLDSDLTDIRCGAQLEATQFSFNYQFDPQTQKGNLSCSQNNQLLKSLDISNCVAVIRSRYN